MKISEFIIQFAKTHSVQHIDDIKNGIIEEAIAENIYLVNSNEVHE